MSIGSKIGLSSIALAFVAAMSLNYNKALLDEEERINNPPLSPTGEPLVMVPCQASQTAGISGEYVPQIIADRFSPQEICTNPDIGNIDLATLNRTIF